MIDLKKQIDTLIEQGEEFTYENFATRGLLGYPVS